MQGLFIICDVVLCKNDAPSVGVVNSVNSEFVLCIVYLLFIYFALDKIADNLVVEVLDGRPLDALLHILLLQKRVRSQNMKHVKNLEIKNKEKSVGGGALPAPPSESAR